MKKQYTSPEVSIVEVSFSTNCLMAGTNVSSDTINKNNVLDFFYEGKTNNSDDDDDWD